MNHGPDAGWRRKVRTPTASLPAGDIALS
jgi:hypothetical protein